MKYYQNEEKSEMNILVYQYYIKRTAFFNQFNNFERFQYNFAN